MEFFKEFQEKGFFRNDMDDSFYERTFEQIFIISDNWIKYLEWDQEAEGIKIEDKIEHYISLCLSLLIPAIKK